MGNGRVLYVNPLPYGANPGADAIAHGLDASLAAFGLELGVVFTDFCNAEAIETETAAIDEAIRLKVAAVVLYILDPGRPRAAVARARAAGIPVITFERPRFPVSASLVYPNYNQGVYLAQELANVLEPGAPVAVIGGPRVIDDEELLDGIIAGVQRCGLSLVNDPRRDEYRNNSDRRAGGRLVAAHVLEAHSQIAGLIPYNDETMLGALDALKDCGTARDIEIVSRNGAPDAIEAVRLGRTLGTWDIDPPGIGAAVGQLVVDTLWGKVLPGTIAIAPIGRFVCIDNITDWQPWDQRVVHSSLRPW